MAIEIAFAVGNVCVHRLVHHSDCDLDGGCTKCECAMESNALGNAAIAIDVCSMVSGIAAVISFRLGSRV